MYLLLHLLVVTHYHTQTQTHTHTLLAALMQKLMLMMPLFRAYAVVADADAAVVSLCFY